MITIEVPTRLTIDDLVNAVEKLPAPELTHFIKRVLAIQTQRGISLLQDDEEQALLDTVQAQSLSAEVQSRLDTLRTKNSEGTLTAMEHAELLSFVQQVEQQDLVRVEALIKLADKRGTTLTDVMQSLGLEATYA